MELTRRSDFTGLEPASVTSEASLEPDEDLEVDGKPFAMQAPVLDASQGSAMFSWTPRQPQMHLAKKCARILSVRCRQQAEPPLTIVGVDYRNSDFGVYPEFVVALTVTVKDDPAGQLFTYYLAIVVAQEFTKEAARIVWGLEKTVSPSLRSATPRTTCCSAFRTRRGRRCRSDSRGWAMRGHADRRPSPSRRRGTGAGTADLSGNDDEKR